MLRNFLFGSDVEALLKLCFSAIHICQIHGFMLSRALDQDNVLLSKFIASCSALGLFDYGYSVFKRKTQPDHVYLYNNMIKYLSLHHSSGSEAILLYNRIQLSGLRPDSYSFPFVLKAAVRLSAVYVGKQVHAQAIRVGFESDVHVGTALVQMYSSAGLVFDGRKVFDGMAVSDVALWNAMVAGYVSNGDIDRARKVFEAMPERNVISWTTLACGYVNVNRPSEAIGIFRRMQLKGVEPDEIAMLAALSACADLGALELGEWIHNYIDKYGLCRTVSLNNCLIDMYVKSGNIVKAFEIFEDMEHRSIVTWTTMIAGFAFHGLGREALEIFFRMERDRVKPNEITFIAILSACSHVGLVELGWLYFNNMSVVYGMKPKIEHYGCMVDLLGRAGHLNEAEDLVMRMPFDANAAIWGSLLAAARVHGDAELAVRALCHLSQMEPGHSGNYALLSNTYAALGRWTEAGMVRKLMRDSGVKKMQGGSSVEVNNTIHDFAAADISHPEATKVKELLIQIIWQSKLTGFEQMEYEGMVG
ncbi:hypothetical protein Ancab_022258 [Ancistrocladus abbreviatus]